MSSSSIFLRALFVMGTWVSGIALIGCETRERFPQGETPPYTSICPTAYQIHSGVSVRYSAIQLDPARKQFELLDTTSLVVSTFIGRVSDASLNASLDRLAISGQVFMAVDIGGAYSGSLTYAQGRDIVTLDCVFEVDQLSTVL